VGTSGGRGSLSVMDSSVGYSYLCGRDGDKWMEVAARVPSVWRLMFQSQPQVSSPACS
jgi:hypothetical protein